MFKTPQFKSRPRLAWLDLERAPPRYREVLRLWLSGECKTKAEAMGIDPQSEYSPVPYRAFNAALAAVLVHPQEKLHATLMEELIRRVREERRGA